MSGKSVWESYKSLSPRTRLYLGLAGIYLSDKLEERYPDEIPILSPQSKNVPNTKKYDALAEEK
ncbi:hypothetical protein G9A89_020612 [Geosiphon pyriformis]|nr:hypothetical protein G9A89_020612 [Geosiphon pyriformis]